MTDPLDDALPDWVGPASRGGDRPPPPVPTAASDGPGATSAPSTDEAEETPRRATTGPALQGEARPPGAMPVGEKEELPRSMAAYGNHHSQVLMAGGSIYLTTGKQLLNVTDFSSLALRTVSRGWVSEDNVGKAVTVADDAAALLSGTDAAMVVIAGPPDHGKRAAGLRALWQLSQTRLAGGRSLELKNIEPDWEDPTLPDCSVLPDAPQTGYLLDVAAEMPEWASPGRVAAALVQHAEKLRKIGSCMVVIADERIWPHDVAPAGGLVRVTTRPSAQLIARKHLVDVHGQPDRVGHVTTGTEAQQQDGSVHLLTDESAPAAGADLAALLAAADGTAESIATALSRFQQWSADVIGVFKRTMDDPEDRALLIAALFLDGEDALTIQKGSRRLLGEETRGSVRDILSGHDLSDRLRKVGARMRGRRASFDYRPGYPKAVLLHLWHQRPDIHDYLLSWLDGTVTDRTDHRRLQRISDLLVELAIAEDDIRIVEKIKDWIDAKSDEQHLRLIAGVLTRTAQADRLGPAVRTRLLYWAKDPKEPLARVVAMVCQGEFAQRYPRQALVRIRHILARPQRDEAVAEAENALRVLASGKELLPLVWRMVNNWSAKQRATAENRAFLAMVDPRTDPYALQTTLAAAAEDPLVAEGLVTGWSAALENPEVDRECRDLFDRWAYARAAGVVPREQVAVILGRVVKRYLTAGPVSALLIGEAGVAYEAPLIELRAELRDLSQTGAWTATGRTAS